MAQGVNGPVESDPAPGDEKTEGTLESQAQAEARFPVGGDKPIRAWSQLPRRQKVMAVGCFVLGAWLALILIAPFTLPSGTVDFGNEGVVSHNDFALERRQADMSGWVAFVYWAGDVNCHQKHDRSYSLNNNQLAFCSRDMALFFGLLGGILLFWRRSYPLPFWAILFGLVPMGLDGGIQLLGTYESANWLRLLTGLIAGATLGLVLGHLATEVSYSRALKRAWEAGRPYISPPPRIPRPYFRGYLAVVMLATWVTATRIVVTVL